jgi:hypothetical protein
LRDRTDGLQPRSDVPDETAHKSILLALSLLKGFTLKEQKKKIFATTAWVLLTARVAGRASSGLTPQQCNDYPFKRLKTEVTKK